MTLTSSVAIDTDACSAGHLKHYMYKSFLFAAASFISYAITIPNISFAAINDSVKNLSSSECEVGRKAAIQAEYKAALIYLNQCIAQADIPESRLAYYLKLRGWTYYELGETQLAVNDYDRALSIPSNGLADRKDFINFAHVLRANRQYKSSLTVLQILADKDKKAGFMNMDTHYHLGWTLHEMKRYGEAIEAYTKGIPSQSDYPFVYWRLVMSYEALNDQEKAKENLVIFRRLCTQKWISFAKESDIKIWKEKLKAYDLDPELGL